MADPKDKGGEFHRNEGWPKTARDAESSPPVETNTEATGLDTEAGKDNPTRGLD